MHAPQWEDTAACTLCEEAHPEDTADLLMTPGGTFPAGKASAEIWTAHSAHIQGVLIYGAGPQTNLI